MTNYELFYRKSTTGGGTWSWVQKLTDAEGISCYADIQTDSNDALHLVWNDDRNGNTEIYYKSSEDGGNNWGAGLRLMENPGSSRNPSLSVDFSNNLHVVWCDDRAGNFAIWYKNCVVETPPVEPMLDIKCNGQDGGVTLTTAENCTLTVECQANDMLGERCDLFIIVQDQVMGDIYTYGPYKGPKWLKTPNNQYYTGGLIDIPTTTVLDMSIAAGSFKAYIAIDSRANGVINVPTIMYMDEVDFTVTE